MIKKTLNLTVVICFLLTSLSPIPAHADAVLGLPQPGTMINLSPSYEPVIIKGLTVHKDNPFLFDFVVDVGQDRMSGEPLKKEGEKLIKYFLASLAIPDKDVWVNLSPYEKNRMIPQTLGQTDMGRDLLEQDYILKQITASLIYPEKQLGQIFWNKVYSEARQKFGTIQMPVNTFNKVWIMADRAEVFEHNQTAFVVDSHLKVMLEEDYLALQKHNSNIPPLSFKEGVRGSSYSAHSLTSQIVKQIILPELEKEVNTGKNFSNLRQIFNSIILSSWYKKNLKEALLNQVYSNQSKIKGIDLNDPTVKEKIYQQYLKAYKKGVFNYIREDVGKTGAIIPHKYFSGGMREGAAASDRIVETTDTAALAKALPDRAMFVFKTGIMIGGAALLAAGVLGTGIKAWISGQRPMAIEMIPPSDRLQYFVRQAAEGMFTNQEAVWALQEQNKMKLGIKEYHFYNGHKIIQMMIENKYSPEVKKIFGDEQIAFLESSPSIRIVLNNLGHVVRLEDYVPADISVIHILRFFDGHSIWVIVPPQIMGSENPVNVTRTKDRAMTAVDIKPGKIDLHLENESIYVESVEGGWAQVILTNGRAKVSGWAPIFSLVTIINESDDVTKRGRFYTLQELVEKLFQQKLAIPLEEFPSTHAKGSTRRLVPHDLKEYIHSKFLLGGWDIKENSMLFTEKTSSFTLQFPQTPSYEFNIRVQPDGSKNLEISENGKSPTKIRDVIDIGFNNDRYNHLRVMVVVKNKPTIQELPVSEHMKIIFLGLEEVERNDEDYAPFFNFSDVAMTAATKLTPRIVSDLFKKPSDQAAVAVNGGIDLNTSNGMHWKIAKDGKGVEMNIDTAMLARIRREGINSLSPVILQIIPITSIWSLVGLQNPSGTLRSV